MININLTDLEESEIKYKISKFPDGQQNITILTSIPNKFLGFNTFLNIKEKILIKSRLNNWLDLELIVATVASLKELGAKEIHLYVPYFLGARSDRKFEEGGNWYLKQVICPIINSLNFESITILDAHSYVLGNLLNNYKAVDNSQLVSFSIKDVLVNNDKAHIKDFIYVAPDAGASHKIYASLKAANIEDQNVIISSKERDAEGKLTKTVVPLKEGLYEKDFIIIDDICDGGRTFINIAKVIKNHYKGFARIPKIYLIVTHGIFSAGFEELSKYFDGIYCTNSYSNVGDYSGNDKQKTNVKQLKII